MKLIKHIKPSKEEQNYLTELTYESLERLRKKLKDEAIVEVGGSFAKNTHLKGNKDIDVFVKFNYKKYKNRSNDISKILEKKLANFDIEKIHGSRDYFQIKQNGIIFEVVPVLNISKSSQAENVTDVSPLHAKWVKKNSNKKIQDEIRLTKQFLIANKLYGAESYIKGFSGYVSELLIIHYKSFSNFIKALAKWKDKTILDPAKKYKNSRDILLSINESKLYSPLIIVDPVQKERNAAASLSEKNYLKLKKLAKEYLERPNESFFKEKEFDLKKLKDYTILEAIPLNEKRDVCGAKLLRICEFITKILKEEGFKIVDSDWNWNNKVHFYFRLKNKVLQSTKKHYGPFLKQKDHLKEFVTKWKKYKIFNEKNRVYINLERKNPDVGSFLKEIIKNPFIQSKVKKIYLIQK